jgi:predicted TIM-barrel fold metal-dependent hydrolase
MVEPFLNTGIDVVIDHFGRPDLHLGITAPGFRYLLPLADSPNIWAKISGAYRNGTNGVGEKTALAEIPLLKSSFGLHRLVWGSDWPYTQFEHRITYDTVFSFLSEMLPGETERCIVLWESSSRLFRF